MIDISYEHKEYLRLLKKKKFNIHLLRIIILLLFLTSWELAAHYKIIDDFIFCSPSILVGCAIDMISQGSLLKHLTSTVTVTIISFFFVTLFSNTAALLLWLNSGLSKVLEPYLIVLNSLPKSALAPLLIVWLGNNRTTVVVAGISVAIFGSVLTLYTSFMSVDEEKVKLIYTLGGDKKCVLFKLLIPGSMPAIINNMKVNIGLCLIGIVIGEMISSKAGLGYLIIYGTQVFKLDYVLLSIIILSMIAMLFYFIMNIAEKRIIKRFC